MGRVSGKVALISGGARGMGAEHARLLVKEGAKVVLGDLLDEDGAAVAAELGAENARYVHLDVTKYDQWESAVQTAVDAFGHLDILVNNAGIVNFAPIDEFPLEAWQQIIDINLTGPFYGIRASVPALRKAGGGSIINVSSIAGLQGFSMVSGYNASKFGVRGLTRSVALDLGHDNIRVNAVLPGSVKTPMNADMDVDQSKVALGRQGEPIELSNLILFLASDESSFCTGADFIADGGEIAGPAGRDPRADDDK
ncbi:glucose 1-dehydrogenase [Microbacterium sp. X-17]|uniref:glucose 1-dehydrogenase n=1 Tax=Microbacterium sp. X-17 TaxID=3144404 RepID=UPI0031F49CD1